MDQEEINASRKMFEYLRAAQGIIYSTLDREKFEENIDFAGNVVAGYEAKHGFLEADAMLAGEKSRLGRYFDMYTGRLNRLFDKRAELRHAVVVEARLAAIKGDLDEMMNRLYDAQTYGPIPKQEMDTIRKFAEQDIEELEEDKKQNIKASLDALIVSST